MLGAQNTQNREERRTEGGWRVRRRRPPQLAPRWLQSPGQYSHTQWALFIPKESEGRAGQAPAGRPMNRPLSPHSFCHPATKFSGPCVFGDHMVSVGAAAWYCKQSHMVRSFFSSSSTDLAPRRETLPVCRVTQGGPRFHSGSHIFDHAEIPVWG